MKTSQFYWDNKNNKIEIWHEDVNGTMNFWMRVNGISEIITERQYKNRIKKYNLKDSI
jgi:hypothetical protein